MCEPALPSLARHTCSSQCLCTSRAVFFVKCRRENSELQLLTKALQSQQQFNILWNAETDHKSVRHTPKPGSWGADHDFMQVHVKYLISIVRLWAFSRGCAGAHSHALPDDDLREH